MVAANDGSTSAPVNFTLRKGRQEDLPRLIELLEMQIAEHPLGEMFKGDGGSMAAFFVKVLELGVIFVGEVEESGEERLCGPCGKRRLESGTPMSSPFVRSAGGGNPDCPTCHGTNRYREPELQGMLAVVALPHHLSGEVYAHEVGFYVHPSYRGSDIARRLVSAIEDWACMKSIRVLQMRAPVGSKLDIVYKRWGFEPVETAHIKRL